MEKHAIGYKLAMTGEGSLAVINSAYTILQLTKQLVCYHFVSLGAVLHVQVLPISKGELSLLI